MREQGRCKGLEALAMTPEENGFAPNLPFLFTIEPRFEAIPGSTGIISCVFPAKTHVKPQNTINHYVSTISA